MSTGRTTSGIVATALLSGVLFGPWSPARADEGGVAFWLSGQFSSFSAVPPEPGASVAFIPYYYNGSSGNSRTFDRGNSLVTGISAQAALLLVQPAYAPETKILGGQPYFAVAFGGGWSETKASASILRSSESTQLNLSDTVSGGLDLYPYASLSWNRGVDNWMTYVTGDIPTGAYQSERLANLGMGHGAIDGGGGYTYFDEKTGREFSSVLGVTYNWKNTHTDYQNGVDLHLDLEASQFLSEQWQVGAVGYVYQQLSADKYSTEGIAGAVRAQALGSFKSRVAAAGPELGYMFKIGNKQAYANLRAYWEFWAQNRAEGYAIFGTVSFPLGN